MCPKFFHCLLLLTSIFGQSFPTLASDEEHCFEEKIRSTGSRGMSCFISHVWGRTEQERQHDDRFVA